MTQNNNQEPGQEPEKELQFEEITGSAQQISELYLLLKSRKYNISHKKTPSFEEHKSFVLQHPYRVWYLIKQQDNFVGSTYLTKENCISVYLKDDKRLVPPGALAAVLEFLMGKHKPLEEQKSLRPPYFHINVAPDDKAFLAKLSKLDWEPIQITFANKQTNKPQ